MTLQISSPLHSSGIPSRIVSTVRLFRIIVKDDPRLVYSRKNTRRVDLLRYFRITCWIRFSLLLPFDESSIHGSTGNRFLQSPNYFDECSSMNANLNNYFITDINNSCRYSLFKVWAGVDENASKLRESIPTTGTRHRLPDTECRYRRQISYGKSYVTN